MNAIHPEDRKHAADEWRRAVLAQRNVSMEFRLRHAESGGWRWTNTRAAPIFSPERMVLKWSGMNIDIHARKENEEAVAADLTAMQTLRELGARLIPETAIQAFYGEVNTAAIKLTGADAGTVQIFDPGSGGLMLLAAHGFPSGFPQHLGQVKATGASSRGMTLAAGERSIDFDDQALEDPHGDLRRYREAGYLSAQSTPLLARSGKPIGMLSTYWRNHRRLTERESRHLDLLARQAADLIEQRLAFTEIQAAYPETESADRAKDHFLAVLSHELRTPLTPVLMALDNILHGDSATLTPFLRDALEMALRNVELEVRLIDDLLDMTRIKQGKLEIARSRVDIHEILRRTLEICQPDLLAKKHRTELDNGAALHWLEGDATRLQQLFWNLIKNACKFTLTHGDILIVTRNPAPGVIKITVSDTGTGIKPKALECIFEPFIQADSQVARQFGGLGLGLAICKAIAEAHGGVLSAANAETGKGAVFTVILPVLPAG